MHKPCLCIHVLFTIITFNNASVTSRLLRHANLMAMEYDPIADIKEV